jgi:predicted alpha-1,2-mannosidase
VLGLIFAAAIAVADPVTLVDPFVGTSGTQQGGPIDDFPGADVPFGMVQWSPDTPSQNAGGGYEYGDRAITGFSLTHLSGPGCNVFGDFAMLPIVDAVNDPTHAQDAFTHANEEAKPGWYSVKLDNGVTVNLTVSQRTGLGSFAFPAGARSTLLIDVASDQAGVLNAHVRISGDDEISGSATTGQFCGMADRYTVYFVARFNRPFVSYGAWNGAQFFSGRRAEDGPNVGAWVTFDATSNPVVEVKTAISYVGTSGALANLAAENRSWDFDAMHARAAQLWHDALGRIAVSGGSPREQTTFYTALYHTLLHPNVFSDADGRYRGYDGKIHRVKSGHAEYANFSDWDIYRTEMPLLALIEPDRASDMAQSLVDAAQQGGLLPRWALVNGPTSVMGGDSPDAVIAGAYAFGARNFDLRGALTAMIRGASDLHAPREDGWYVERPELAEYLRRGYIVNTHTTSVAPVPNGASETQEYSFDDFSIARIALALHDQNDYRTFMQRASNWENLFDTATGLIAPRDGDGAFMQTPITAAGESGFQEGNAAQYTWIVPHDLRDLITGMGGAAIARARLDAFFTQLNAGQNEPYAWLGNEPSIGSPWVYLSDGAPYRAQSIVRRALLELYDDSPVGLPGNDDLGTMSAWYVWCALGLYPQNPAVRYLDVGSPLFTHAVVTVPNGPTITIDAPNAADDAPYVQSLQIDGLPTQKPWLALPMNGTVRLSFDLAATPNESWGAAAEDAPPSYAISAPHFPASSAVTLAAPAAIVPLVTGSPATLAVTVANTGGSSAQVAWHVTLPSGIEANASSGETDVAAGATATIALTLTSTLQSAHFESVRFDASVGPVLLQHVDAIVRTGAPSSHIALGFVENIYDNSVSPIDLATGTLLPKIAVGSSPRDAAFGGGMLYVCDRDDAKISVVDPRSLAVVSTIKVGNGPSGILADPGGATLWFVNAYSGTVQSIDAQSGIASAPIEIGGTLRSAALAGSTLYVTVSSNNEVIPIDVRTKAIGKPIAVGEQPEGIAATPDGKWLYVVNHGSNDVTPIDVATGMALHPISVGVAPVNVTLSADGRAAYVSNAAIDSITIVDLAKNEARHSVVTGGEPYGMAISDATTLWIVNRQDNDLVPLNASDDRVGAAVLDPYGPLTIVAPPSYGP